MKISVLLLCIVVCCCSCTRQEEKLKMFPRWDGESPLDSAGKGDIGEPILIIWYEPVEGLDSLWYPRKIFCDTKVIKEMRERVRYPEQQAHYTLKTNKYLLIYSVGRSLRIDGAILVPFILCENGYALIPSGKDRKLYEILTSAPEKENFYDNNPSQTLQVSEYEKNCESSINDKANNQPNQGIGF